jgi:hypothetical protein
MIIESDNDLNGDRLDHPVPIEFVWNESMKVRGQENVAQFSGDVQVTRLDDGPAKDKRIRTHLSGQQLRAELRDVPVDTAARRDLDWGLFQPIVDRFSAERTKQTGRERAHKEISSIYLLDDAVVRTEELDPLTGALRSRARLAGPRMSVNLRPEISKALVEGAGTLQLEGFEARERGRRAARPSNDADLFGGIDGAPSKTLIEWQGRMWYDFGIRQVRFEDQVDLKFLSGAQLDRFFSGPDDRAVMPQGRATFIRSDLLTVMLAASDASERKSVGMGGLSAEGITRFQATGNVVLKDEVESVMNWITATELTYDRPRNLIIVSGVPKEHARIVRQEPGKLPMHLYVENAFYDPATGKATLSKPAAHGN